jgi:DNA mismatch repair ATPase MutS
MKVRLLYRDSDFDLNAPPLPGSDALVQDLGLAALFSAMSRGDAFLSEVGRQVTLVGTTDIDTIRYRQDVLRDCLERRPVVEEMYNLASGAIEAERKDIFGSLARTPSSVLFRSNSLLGSLAVVLSNMRSIADEHLAGFRSEGFKTLLEMIRRELSDEYLARIHEHLRRLGLPGGMLISAHLGEGDKGAGYVLREQPEPVGGLMALFSRPKTQSYSFRIAEQDEAGARALEELRTRGLSLVAAALGESTEHVLSFLKTLQMELAFYLGCAHLHDLLSNRGRPVCFPEPAGPQECRLWATGLYDVGLAIDTANGIVANDLCADAKDLVFITGANQGGKSTFLRAIGVAQLMMQCGMFAPAESFRANVSARIFTHFKRPEDPTMKSGKFDEELLRMSSIVDRLVPSSMILFNESFAATNELEGSEIAEQIVSALLERGIKVLFVTHQFELACRFSKRKLSTALFLRADRRPDGTRTFKMIEGAPEKTGHGVDLYEQIFGCPTSKSGHEA